MSELSLGKIRHEKIILRRAPNLHVQNDERGHPKHSRRTHSSLAAFGGSKQTMEARHEQWCGGYRYYVVTSLVQSAAIFLVLCGRLAPIDQKYAGKEPTTAKSKPKLLASTPALFRPASPTTPSSRRSRNHPICAPLPGEPTDPTGGPGRHRDRPVSARQTDPRLTFSFTQCFLLFVMMSGGDRKFSQTAPPTLSMPNQNKMNFPRMCVALLKGHS